MNTRRSLNSLLAGGLLVGLSAGGTAQAQPSTADVQSAAVDAYIYGYPLVTMELTRRNFTNVAKPDGKSAPMGYFVNVPKYPPASDKRVTERRHALFDGMDRRWQGTLHLARSR